MKIDQPQMHYKLTHWDGPHKHKDEGQTSIPEMTDSPRGYCRSRKNRGARKHTGELPGRVSKLRDTLKAQGLAGKHDSAEAYAALFGPDAKVDDAPSDMALPAMFEAQASILPPCTAAKSKGPTFLRADDYDMATLVAMSDSQFNSIDFSRPERPMDLSECPSGSAVAPKVFAASARSGRACAPGPAPVSDDEFEYVPEIEAEAPRRLSSQGAAILARMSNEDLARCDVTDYFEPVTRRRSIDAPATDACTS